MINQSPEVKQVAITITAIGALTVLEVVALLKGINGTLLTLVVAAISGLGGYSLSSFVHRTSPPK